MLGIYAVCALSAGLDSLVAARVLLAGSGGVRASSLARCLGYTGMFALAKALVLLVVLPQSSFFLLFLLAWLLLVVSAPLVGLACLRAARTRPVSAGVRATAWAGLALAALGVWGTFVEPLGLSVEHQRVPLDAARTGERMLRVGVLADLQARAVGAHERAAVRELMELEPDLILIPGDVAQVWPRDPAEALEEFRALLAQLRAPLGVYLVLGNTDDLDFVRALLPGSEVRLLDDEVVRLEHAGMRITLAGLRMAGGSARARGVLAELEQRGDEGDVRLVFAHYPDALFELPAATRVDLLVAGHTHGGQVQLPWIGPPITLSRVARQIAAGGLHELDGRRVYVSRGVGVERNWAPRLRLLCPPEVSLLELEPARASR